MSKAVEAGDMQESLVTDSSKPTNLRARLITASVVTPITVLASLAGGWWFVLAVLPIMCIGVLEFFVMEKDTPMQGSSLTGIPTAIALVLGLTLGLDWLWQAAIALGIVLTLALEYARHPKQIALALAQVGTTACGVAYLALPAAFLISLRKAPENGLTWLFIVFAITWGTDTFGYVFGRAFGKTKLAPLISPNKTVEGALGGMLGAWIPAGLILAFSGAFQPILVPMIALGPLLAVVGDLFESAMKRFFRVKDSFVAGLNVFPGHGGVLDRVDALVWVASWVFLYLTFVGLL